MNSLHFFLILLSFITGILLGKIFVKYQSIKPILVLISKDYTLNIKYYLINTECISYFDRMIHKKQYYKRLNLLLHKSNINIFWWYLYKLFNKMIF